MPQGPALLSYAHPVVVDLTQRADRLGATVTELRWVAGRNTEIGYDVELVRPQRRSHTSGFVDSAARLRLDAHLEAARHGRDQEAQRLLVLEDGIEFDRRWHAVGRDVLAELDSLDWDIADLGHCGSGDVEPDPTLRSTAHWRRVTRCVPGGHAYLLHRHFLDSWIAHLESIVGTDPGDPRHGSMRLDGALDAITRLDPLTMRYLATPSLVGWRPPLSGGSRRAAGHRPRAVRGLSRLRVGRPLARRR